MQDAATMTKRTYKFDDYSTPLTLEEVRVVARDTAAEYIKMRSVRISRSTDS